MFLPVINKIKIATGINCEELYFNDIVERNVLIISSKNGAKRFQKKSYYNDFECKNNIKYISNVSPNPDIKQLEKNRIKVNKINPNYIIGFGGGSVLDSAKILRLISSKNTINESLFDLLETKKPIPKSDIELVLIPTTSGTGSEVTPFATVWDQENKLKHSLSSKKLFPDQVLLNIQNTINLDSEITINTGLDAINQCLESIWNKYCNYNSYSYAMWGLKYGLESILSILENNNNLNRSNLMRCSLYSGLAISITRTSICHSISYVLTNYFKVPHGLACAFTMLSVLEYNFKHDDGRFKQLQSDLNCKCILHKIKTIVEKCKVKTKVKKYVKDKEKLIELLNEMLHKDRAGNNYVKISKETLLEIINKSWD
jgi:alcohol dehydrogenase